MAKIEKLCSTPEYTKYFKDIQRLGKFDLFKRFDDIELLVNKKIGEKYRHFLATPFIDGDSIEWFSKPYSETPQRLSELQDEDRSKYEQVKNETLNHYKSVTSALRQEGKSNEAEALENATKFVNDDFVYCFDDKTVLGIWGMQLRENVREPLGIAMKNIFVKKKKAPQPQPEVEPPLIDESEPESKPAPEPQPQPEEPPIDPYTVRFNAGEGGNLNGPSEYAKYDGDIITKNEVPQVEPKEGYEFIGWDKNPNNYRVTDDTDFTAQYREIIDDTGLPWWKRLWGRGMGCLNWLLLLLLLALIFMVIWCCFLKRCNFNFCGCGCPEETTIIIPPPNPNPKPTPGPPSPCNAKVASGGYEGYVGYFDMGQKSGSFIFQYETYTVPDKITIYEGKGTSGKVLFTYSGGTDGWRDVVVNFNESIITVEIIGQEYGTSWAFQVNCPTGQNH